MVFSTKTPIAQLNFSRALEKDVKLSSHAEDQMMSRGIPWPTVLAIIANGNRVPNEGTREKIHFLGWCVVMDNNWVITTYEI